MTTASAWNRQGPPGIPPVSHEAAVRSQPPRQRLPVPFAPPPSSTSCVYVIDGRRAYGFREGLRGCVGVTGDFEAACAAWGRHGERVATLARPGHPAGHQFDGHRRTVLHIPAEGPGRTGTQGQCGGPARPRWQLASGRTWEPQGSRRRAAKGDPGHLLLRGCPAPSLRSPRSYPRCTGRRRSAVKTISRKPAEHQVVRKTGHCPGGYYILGQRDVYTVLDLVIGRESG